MSTDRNPPTFAFSSDEIKDIARELTLTMEGSTVITVAQVGRIALGLDADAIDPLSLKIREALAARLIVNAGEAFGIVPCIPPHVEARALAIPEIVRLKEQVNRARLCLGHIADILRMKRQSDDSTMHAGNTAFISLERWASEGLEATPFAKPLQQLFDHMAAEHGLTLLDSELYEIERHAAFRYVERVNALHTALAKFLAVFNGYAKARGASISVRAAAQVAEEALRG